MKVRFEVTGVQGGYVFPGLGVTARTRDILTVEGEDKIKLARNCPVLTEIKTKKIRRYKK